MLLVTLLFGIYLSTAAPTITSGELEILINDKEEILVLFTSATCKQCDNYKKELSQTIEAKYHDLSHKHLKSVDFYIMNCDSNKSYCNQNNIKSFPYSKFFYQGGDYTYNTFFIKKEVIDFIKKIKNKSAVKFNLKDFNSHHKRALESAELTTLFIGDINSKEFMLYLRMVKSYTEDRFYRFDGSLEQLSEKISENGLEGGDKHIIFESIQNQLQTRPNMVIYKHGKSYFYNIEAGDSTLMKLQSHYDSIKHPYLVTNANEMLKLYKEMSPLFVMIMKSGDENMSRVSDEFGKKADEQQNNSNFALIDVEKIQDKDLNELLQEFEIDGKRPKLPAIVYFQPDFESLKYKKHVLTKTPTSATIKKFIKECIAGDDTPILKVNSRKFYDFSDYEALNTYNIEKTLTSSPVDVVVLMFQDKRRYASNLSHEGERMPLTADMKILLKAVKEFEHDSNLNVYLFNLSKNEILNFVPDLQKDCMLLYLKDMKFKDVQVFQKDGLTIKDATNLISKRSEFDKRNFDTMMGGKDGDGGDTDFENMDLEALFAQLGEMNLDGMDQGGEGMEGMQGMAELLKQMGGMMGGGMGGMEDMMKGMGGMGDMMKGMGGMEDMMKGMGGMDNMGEMEDMMKGMGDMGDMGNYYDEEL